MDRFVRARDNRTGRVVNIRSLPRSRNGDRCDCRCVECNQPVRAFQGWINAWHFRHVIQLGCTGGNPMSALHKEATQILLETGQVLTKYDGFVTYFNSKSQYPIGDSRFLADVHAWIEVGVPLVLEVRVTHECSYPKIDYVANNKISCIEIDLHDVDAGIASENLRHIFLEDFQRHRYIYWEHAMKAPLVDDMKPPSDSPETKTASVARVKKDVGNPIAIILCLYSFHGSLASSKKGQVDDRVLLPIEEGFPDIISTRIF